MSNILGIDIVGTGIKGASVDLKNCQLLTDRYRIPTPSQATVEAVVDTVKQLVDYFQWEGLIGCGFPAAIKHEKVMNASNIHESWIGVDAAKMIYDQTGCTTHLLNDVDAAGMAEMKYGAGKNMKKGVIAMVAVGTGIGTAIFTDGVLLPNTELGHIIVNGQDGEKYCSNATRKNLELSWPEWTACFNDYLDRLESLFWPDLIILGGGLCKYHDYFLQDLKVKSKLVIAKLFNNAGIVGAALAAQESGYDPQ